MDKQRLTAERFLAKLSKYCDAEFVKNHGYDCQKCKMRSFCMTRPNALTVEVFISALDLLGPKSYNDL